MSKFVIQVVDGKVLSRAVLSPGSTVAEGFVEVSREEFEQAVLGATQTGSGFDPPAARQEQLRISKYEFLKLLTPAEYAVMFNPQTPELKWGLALWQVAPDPFNIADPVTTQLLDYCEQAGTITNARKRQLLAAMQAKSLRV